MEAFPDVVDGNKARKRIRNAEMWTRTKEKRARYGPPGPPKHVICVHAKKAVYKCAEVSNQDKLVFHQKFYDLPKDVAQAKIKQDSFILKYTHASTPKRSRLVDASKGEPSMTVKYFMYNTNNKEKIQVCQKMFLNSLRLSKNRVNAVVLRHFKSGEMPVEKRGGDRKQKLYEIKKRNVIDFIKKFKIIENHYCRGKGVSRVYLPSDLNIKKMWRIYNAETISDEKRVKPSYFRHIFRTKFNIGFGSPSTDECSTCISLIEQIKRTKDPILKENLCAQKLCHKSKADKFYSLLREKRKNLFTVSFDCQKNQVLPKVSDQSAYYSRQIYEYNLTVVVGHSKAKQTNNNIFIYHWDESEHAKGANEIGSAIYHFLIGLQIPENIVHLRLASDGCGGQNKNSFMMGIISLWLFNYAPRTLKTIEYVFPVVGHSFLPSDRVFARIEKEIQGSSEPIVTPEQYCKIFSNHGTLVSLAGKVYDWKTSVKDVVKLPGNWHFKFNPCKVFYFKRNKKGDNILIKGEENYRSHFGKYMSVCKKGKTIKDMLPPDIIPTGEPIAPLKLRDVTALLAKHFGDDWRDMEILNYYNKILENPLNNRLENNVHYKNEEPCCTESMAEIIDSL